MPSPLLHWSPRTSPSSVVPIPTAISWTPSVPMSRPSSGRHRRPRSRSPHRSMTCPSVATASMSSVSKPWHESRVRMSSRSARASSAPSFHGSPPDERPRLHCCGCGRSSTGPRVRRMARCSTTRLPMPSPRMAAWGDSCGPAMVNPSHGSSIRHSCRVRGRSPMAIRSSAMVSWSWVTTPPVVRVGSMPSPTR